MNHAKDAVPDSSRLKRRGNVGLRSVSPTVGRYIVDPLNTSLLLGMYYVAPLSHFPSTGKSIADPLSASPSQRKYFAAPPNSSG
ncbi:MAG: hypothetical protein AAF632_00280 [Bacteroidota bacterium]